MKETEMEYLFCLYKRGRTKREGKKMRNRKRAYKLELGELRRGNNFSADDAKLTISHK
jgi:hypothetical protein